MLQLYQIKCFLSIQDLTNFLDTIEPSLIILQNITFANAAYASEVLKKIFVSGTALDTS